MIYICKTCSREFEDKPCRKRIFCSADCAGTAIRRFDLLKLIVMVLRGDLGKRMAAELGITPGRVHHILSTYGMRDLWRERRRERYPSVVLRSRGRRVNLAEGCSANG